jgi:Flp pilus assembly protein TadD
MVNHEAPSFDFSTTERPTDRRSRRIIGALVLIGAGIVLLAGIFCVQVIRFRIAIGNANHLYESGRYQEAGAAYKQVIDAFPPNDLAHLYRGESLLMLHRFPEARVEMERAVKLEPDDAHNQIRLAQALWQCEDVVGAEREFRKGLGLDQNEAEGHFQLANLLVKARRFDEAWPELQEARRCSPNDESVLGAMRSFQLNHADSVGR